MANGFKRHRLAACGPWTAARLPVTGNRLQRWVTQTVGLPRYAAAVLNADAKRRRGEPLTAREARLLRPYGPAAPRGLRAWFGI